VAQVIHPKHSLTGHEPNDTVVFMIPAFRRDGTLPLGLHPASWTNLGDRFGRKGVVVLDPRSRA
jgi:hypothetical protein